MNRFDVSLRRIWAGAILLLVLLSHRLWIPSQHWSDEASNWAVAFPRVPMISLSGTAAYAIDAVSLVTLLVALAMILLRRDSAMSWRPMVLIAVSFAALFVSNQHRLQPWAYQSWLYAIVFAGVMPRSVRGYVTLLTISIYTYSALGKFDQQFLKTVGPSMIGTLLGLFGIEGGDGANERLRWWTESAVYLLPTAELAIAGMLVFARTRRVGAVAAITMHLSLVAILGPLGLGHSAAVLAWNLFLAVQAWMLFFRADSSILFYDCGDVADAVSKPLAGRVAAGGVVLAALMLPMLERRPSREVYGYWDHWLSWSLYSPHTSRVEIQVHETAIAGLPEVVEKFSRVGEEDDGWVTILIDRWSLAELAVPVYPQARFQLGLAHEIALQLDSNDDGRPSKRGAIRIKVRGVADRRSGKREEVWAMGADGIAKQRERFWLLPR